MRPLNAAILVLLTSLLTSACKKRIDPPPPPPPPPPVPCPTCGNTPTQPPFKKWTKSTIKYRLKTASGATLPVGLFSVYTDAAGKWTQEIPLQIKSAGDQEAVDVDVFFCRPDEVDRFCPLLRDGAGFFLGRAELPNADQPIKQWILLDGSLTDLASLNNLSFVILHELGHTLGLEHIGSSGAVMNPDSSPDIFSSAPQSLQRDDKSAAHDRYGRRDGSQPPLLPRLPDIPRDPTAGPPPGPPNEDPDRDGLSSEYERTVSLTNPDVADTDGDGLSDGFEVSYYLNPLESDSDGDGRSDFDEVVAGTFARTPVVCQSDDDASSDNVIWVSRNLLEDRNLANRDHVAVNNLRSGCGVQDVKIRDIDDPICQLKIPKQLRESLCIYQVGAAVPIALCLPGSIQGLVDFEGIFRSPVVDSAATTFQVVSRNGSKALEVHWSLATPGDFRFLVMQLVSAQSVKPCDRLLVDVETDRFQEIEVGAKTGIAPSSIVRKDHIPFPVASGQILTVNVPMTSRFALTEVEFVIVRSRNTVSNEGVFWIDNIRLDVAG